MADVQIYIEEVANQEDTNSDQADGVGENGCNSEVSDEKLTPLAQLQKIANANDSWNRQMVGRRLLQLMREYPATDFIPDMPDIMELISNIMFFDNTPNVKTELLEHIPQIAMACMEFNDQVMSDVVEKYILPLVIKCYEDSDPQVRTSSRTATLLLLEHNIVDQYLIKRRACPAIIEVSYKDSEDFVSSAVIFMAKMSRFLGRYFVEIFFLPRFIELCSYDKFSVRRIAAASIGEFCAVASRKSFEKLLLPQFVVLCNDSIWGVRKHCAEVIVAVSCVCPPKLRRTVLSPAFEQLLDDQSRWVKLTACQSLGPFISTFAEPRITELHYLNGDLVIIDSNSCVVRSIPNSRNSFDEYREPPSQQELTHNSFYSDNIEDNTEDTEAEKLLLDELRTIVKSNLMKASGEPMDIEEETFDTVIIENSHMVEGGSAENNFDVITNDLSDLDLNSDNIENIVNNNNNDEAKVINSDVETEPSDDIDKYNSHLFWSVPLPDIKIDLEILKTDKNKNNDTSPKPVPFKKRTHWNYFEKWSTTRPTYPRANRQIVPSSQSIVPDFLIERFTSMADSVKVEQVDSELCYQCAFSFPAVALTLGKENWHLIAPTYSGLSAEFHWKVRLAVAVSLHEIAQILGEELATEYLAPIFDDFIKDVDQVRIGILKNMTQFFKMISSERRNQYLSRMFEFLQTDTVYNWRFRCELSSQLLQSIELWPPADVSRYIMPVAMDLLDDRVAAVRSSAILLVSELVRIEVTSSNKKTNNSIYEIVNLAHSKGWQRRQIFVTLCGHLVHALPPDVFGKEIMPHFLDLTWDPVANVRLVVARVICQNILNHDFYADPQGFHNNSLVIVLKRLQSDQDRDVREAAFKTFVNLCKTQGG